MDPIFDLQLRPDIDSDMVLAVICRTCITDQQPAAERQADYDADRAIRVPDDPEDKALIAEFGVSRFDLSDVISEVRLHWRAKHVEKGDGPCSCICHRMPGVHHIVACCKFPPMPDTAEPEEDVILTQSPATDVQVVEE